MKYNKKVEAKKQKSRISFWTEWIFNEWEVKEFWAKCSWD